MKKHILHTLALIITIITALFALIIGTYAAENIEVKQEKTTYLSDAKITKTEVSASAVKLTWGKITGANSYRVYQKVDNKWTKISDTSNTSYTVSGLDSATNYTFTVRPFNGNLTSKSYSPVTVTTKSIELSDVKITGTSATESTVKLTWGKVSGAKEYIVYRKINDKWTRIAVTSNTSYTLSNLESATAYTLTVRPVNGGSISKSYFPVTVTTKAIDLSDVKITGASATESTITLTWNKVAGAKEYCIYKKVNDKWTRIDMVTDNIYTLYDLDSATNYTLTVRPVNGGSISKGYSPVTVTTRSINLKDVVITGTTSATSSIKLTWDTVTGAKTYGVYKKVGNEWVRVAFTSGTSYTVSGLSSNTKYTFTVRAYNGGSKSKSYSPITVATKAINLSNVKITGASVTTSSVKLSWDAVTYANGYNIYKKSGSSWVKIASTKNTNYTISNLAFNREYTFAVEAYNGGSKSKSKTSKSVKTKAKVLKGIDVSYWQGDIDYNKVKKRGIDFVIIRAGFGELKDSMFETNYKKAKAAGMNVGVYWYSYAESNSEALKEAKACLQVLKGKTFEFPIYYDYEEHYVLVNNEKAFHDKMIKSFCDEIEKAGYFTGLYTSRSYAQYQISAATTSRYALWLAEYGPNCNYSGTYGMWQYSASEKVSGISTDVDGDYCYMDYPTIIKEKKLNGFK